MGRGCGAGSLGAVGSTVVGAVVGGVVCGVGVCMYSSKGNLCGRGGRTSGTSAGGWYVVPLEYRGFDIGGIGGRGGVVVSVAR